MLAGQEELVPQEPLDSNALMGGLAGQDHQLGVLHESPVWGYDVRLGQCFWKHTETGRGPGTPFASLLPIWGPQDFPGMCVYVVCGLCVCVLHMTMLCGWGI